jgi:hypothetical protein
MTDMAHGDVQASNFASTPVTPSSAPAAPTQTPTEERTFRQQEVNDIASRRAQEAVERYKRETSMASHQQPQHQPQHSQQPQYQAPVVPQSPGMSDEQYRRIAAEEATRSRNEWIQESHRNQEEQNAARIASEFFTKVGAGEGGREGFDKIVAESGLDLRSIPYHVQLANMVDNTREVMVELVKNPSKIGTIQNLIDIDLRAGRQPNLAMAEIKRLSASLKDNAKASNYRAPNDPLSQMRPSNAGTDNKGPLTVSDYRKRYKV